MSRAGMSPAAMARCKKLTIEEQGGGVCHLTVTDPRVSGRKVDSSITRTPQDLERIKRAFMGKHRIPAANVTVVEHKAAAV